MGMHQAEKEKVENFVAVVVIVIIMRSLLLGVGH